MVFLIVTFFSLSIVAYDSAILHLKSTIEERKVLMFNGSLSHQVTDQLLKDAGRLWFLEVTLADMNKSKGVCSPML